MPYEFGSVSSGIINSLLAFRPAYPYSAKIMILEQHRTKHCYAPILIRFPERNKLIVIFFYLFEIQILNYCLQRVMAEYISELFPAYVAVYYDERNTVKVISVFFKFSGLEFLKRRMMIPYYN